MALELDLALRPEDLASDELLRLAAARHAGISADRVAAVAIRRRTIDARSRPVKIRVKVALFLDGESVPAREPPPLELPQVARGGVPVVIVGSGPAGLFAALSLAERGIAATVLERGKSVQPRRRDIAALNKQGIVDPESNYCFGEGGAGTYSDGKLYTRSDKRGSVDRVLEVLVAHGAPPDIRVDSRPHIGSNRLPRIVTGLRETLERAGVLVRFEARVDDLFVDGGRVRGVRLAGGEEIAASAVVMAAGHSAHEMVERVASHGARIEAKGFAVGVRAEHPQALIDAAQYGDGAERALLPAASYRLAATIEGRGVYSFCMCPGGWIVPASTAADRIVVNGMSLSRRDSPFANSGIVVSIEPADLAALGLEGPLAGFRFQTEIERLAATLGGGAQVAPAQRLQDFVAGKESASLPRSSYRPGLRSAPLHAALPEFLARRLREALRRFGRTLRGYDTGDALVVGVESRSSSPVRVVRDAQSLESPTLPGLFPCGEGAGYAGGIVSAALDGAAVADRVCVAVLR